MKGLFLDDERYPADVTWLKYDDSVEWTVVRTPEEFKGALYMNNYDIISFDHDIQAFEDGVETTGYTLLKWLCTEANVDSDLHVEFHTQNPIGKQNMQAYWKSYQSFVLGV